jgi:hypothetical protein
LQHRRKRYRASHRTQKIPPCSHRNPFATV